MLTVNDLSVSVSSQLTVVRKPGVRPLHRSAKPHGLVGLEVAPFAFLCYHSVSHRTFGEMLSDNC